MKTLRNKRGEGYVFTAAVVIITIVIGAVLISGFFLLFSGNNGIFKNVDTKIDLMLAGDSVEVRRTYSAGRYIIQYSFDGENWKNADIPGFDAVSSVTVFINNGMSSSPVWLVSFTSATRAYVCSSTNGIGWTPVFNDSRSVTLIKSGSTIYVQCYDGRAYKSADGVNWIMTSTKRY